MGDLKGLFQTITEVMPLDKQPELLNKISKGRFSLRDLYEQLGSLTQYALLCSNAAGFLI